MGAAYGIERYRLMLARGTLGDVLWQGGAAACVVTVANRDVGAFTSIIIAVLVLVAAHAVLIVSAHLGLQRMRKNRPKEYASFESLPLQERTRRI